MPEGPVGVYNTLWIDGGSCGLSEYPKDVSVPFKHKTVKRNLLVGKPKSTRVFQTLF